jgi:hypothetical protein
VRESLGPTTPKGVLNEKVDLVSAEGRWGFVRGPLAFPGRLVLPSLVGGN